MLPVITVLQVNLAVKALKQSVHVFSLEYHDKSIMHQTKDYITQKHD